MANRGYSARARAIDVTGWRCVGYSFVLGVGLGVGFMVHICPLLISISGVILNFTTGLPDLYATIKQDWWQLGKDPARLSLGFVA